MKNKTRIAITKYSKIRMPNKCHICFFTTQIISSGFLIIHTTVWGFEDNKNGGIKVALVDFITVFLCYIGFKSCSYTYADYNFSVRVVTSPQSILNDPKHLLLVSN